MRPLTIIFLMLATFSKPSTESIGFYSVEIDDTVLLIWASSPSEAITQTRERYHAEPNQ